jgi:hypothetical protein
MNSRFGRQASPFSPVVVRNSLFLGAALVFAFWPSPLQVLASPIIACVNCDCTDDVINGPAVCTADMVCEPEGTNLTFATFSSDECPNQFPQVNNQAFMSGVVGGTGLPAQSRARSNQIFIIRVGRLVVTADSRFPRISPFYLVDSTSYQQSCETNSDALASGSRSRKSSMSPRALPHLQRS